MIRRPLSAVLIAGVLLASQAAQALSQPAQTPLRTLCLSRMQEYCMSIFTWDWTAQQAGVLGPVFLSTTVSFFGAGLVENAPWREMAFQTASDGDSFYMFVRDSTVGVEPGVYNVTQDGSSRLFNWVPSVYEHIQWMHFLDGTSRRWCDPRVATIEGGCYEVSVPEPSTWLLMLTGLFGLGFVAWRRRGEDVAA